MPFAQIYILEGRSDAQKSSLIREMTEAIHRSLDAPRETIRVMVAEVPRTQWGIGGETVSELDAKNGVASKQENAD